MFHAWDATTPCMLAPLGRTASISALEMAKPDVRVSRSDTKPLEEYGCLAGKVT